MISPKFVVLVTCLLALSVSEGNAQDCAAADNLVRGVNVPSGITQREAAYRGALATCPQHAGALNNLGFTYEEMGRLEDALTYYHRSVAAFTQANGSPATPLFGIGDVYRKMKRNDDALYWYRKGLEADPNDADSRRAVAELTKNDPASLVGSRSIGAALSDTRGIVVAPVALSEKALPFAFNSADLLPAARPQLREIAYAIYDKLNIVPGSRGIIVTGVAPVAVIAGHADRRGSPEYNERLARRRAEAVVNVLVKDFGIPAARLRVQSYGASQPKCNADTEDCFATNRRVEISKP